MKTIEYKTTDKSDWGPGPWQDEPDKMQFPDPITGLPCLIVRNFSGALCGYVGVAEGHPYYGKDYNNIEADVHGGLTFANACSPGGDEAKHICHLPGEGEPDHVWWFGFDCAHSGDLSPKMHQRYGSLHYAESYRTIAYVKSEIASLARQLAEAA